MVTAEAELIERSFGGRLVRGKINYILSSIISQLNAKDVHIVGRKVIRLYYIGFIGYIYYLLLLLGYRQRYFQKRNV